MNEKRIKGSWWVAIVAFGAGMAVHAAASGHRPEASTLMATPATIVATPAAESGSGYRLADADSDTCGVQLN
jgi:hypothetical protein